MRRVRKRQASFLESSPPLPWGQHLGLWVVFQDSRVRSLGSHPDPVILEGGRFSGGEEGMGETFADQGMVVTIWALSLGRSSRRARRPTRRGRNHYISIWGESLG